MVAQYNWIYDWMYVCLLRMIGLCLDVVYTGKEVRSMLMLFDFDESFGVQPCCI